MLPIGVKSMEQGACRDTVVDTKVIESQYPYMHLIPMLFTPVGSIPTYCKSFVPSGNKCDGITSVVAGTNEG